MSLRERVLQRVIERELFYSFIRVDGKKVYTYELEGYDKEKIEAEGSIWIVYVYDCMRDYYEKHSEEIDSMVNDELRSALTGGVT